MSSPTVTPGTSYDVAVSYRIRGLVTDRLVLGPVTAGALAIAGVVTSTKLDQANQTIQQQQEALTSITTRVKALEDGAQEP